MVEFVVVLLGVWYVHVCGCARVHEKDIGSLYHIPLGQD